MELESLIINTAAKAAGCGEYKMKSMAVIALLLSLCIVLPIWFYLLHVILTAISADSLAWFLYWAYLPITVIVTVIGKILESTE